MITLTPRTLITSTMVMMGVLEAGETPTADQQADGLSRLNSLIDSWGLQPNTMRTVTRTAFTITANVQSYSVGTGATINLARPDDLFRVSYVVSGSSPEDEIFLSKLTDDQYETIVIKALESGEPTAFHYRLTDPTATLFLWPLPTATLDGYLYSPTAVTQFAAVGTSYTLVPGLERVLRFNLAVDWAPEFGRRLDPQIRLTAVDALQEYKRANYRMADMQMDPAFAGFGGRGVYNILTDR